MDRGVVSLESHPAQLGDVLDGLHQHLTLQDPGQLIEPSLGGEVPCDDVLQVKRDVVFQQNFLIFFREAFEEEERCCEISDCEGDHAQLIGQSVFLD